MILSKVRSYIESKIKEVDRSFKAVDTPFDIDVAENNADKSYYIKYNVVSTEQLNTHVKDSIDAEVTFSFKAFRDNTNKYDDVMNLVNTIRMKCINITEIQEYSDVDQNKIMSCLSVSQIGEQLPNNNKQIIITLSLEFSVNQSIC